MKPRPGRRCAEACEPMALSRERSSWRGFDTCPIELALDNGECYATRAMARFNYNDKVFVGVENYHDGDMTGETRFHYFQRGDVVWGIFDGGNVAKGTLVARVLEDDRLAMIWQYLNNDGQFFSGSCTAVPELLPDGRYRLHESWQVTGRDGQTGTSVIEEVRG